LQVGAQKSKKEGADLSSIVPVKSGFMAGYEVVKVDAKKFEAEVASLSRLITDLERQFDKEKGAKEFFYYLRNYFKMFRDRYFEEKKDPAAYAGRNFVNFSKDGGSAKIELFEMMNRYGSSNEDAVVFLSNRLQEASDRCKK